jgi:UDP-N-acetyl-2-amino-2-deoxyglucuronate dehydrogenase
VTFRVGIIGCGRIVEDAHAPSLAALAGVAAVVALADPSPERRQAVGAVLGAEPAGFDDWQELLARVPLDVAVVAVPHHLHTAAIVDAAGAGVDVVSEKPLANTIDEIDEIAAAVAAAGVRLSVMHNWIRNPDARAAVELVAGGAIGEPFLVRSESIWGVPWAGRDPRGNWRLNQSQSGGGIVIDAVYHAVYASEAEMRSPVAAAYAALADRGGGVEDTALIVLTHENGGLTSIQRSWSVRGGGAGVHEIHGSRGSLRFRQGDPLAVNRIMAGEPPPPAAAPAAPALELFDNDRGAWEPVPVEAAPWWSGIREVFAATFAAWRDGRDAPAGIAEARHVLEVIAALYASAETGRAVSVAGPPAVPR